MMKFRTVVAAALAVGVSLTAVNAYAFGLGDVTGAVTEDVVTGRRKERRAALAASRRRASAPATAAASRFFKPTTLALPSR